LNASFPRQRNIVLKICVFYFLKDKKVFFSIQNLIFVFTFRSLTNAPKHRLSKPIQPQVKVQTKRVVYC